ncbi:hypothetical protein [Georgenia sp. MJ170]|uniref:hypothetical protein n=1 Tax=Georgenia sunbinii TaxID=3117728 RepID=UPI002F265032
MNNKHLLARAGIGVTGAMLLVSGAAVAVADEVAGEDVEVNVEIEAQEPVGALTMSVASDSTALIEVESSDADVRQFNGTLPTVTVSDDRQEVPEGVFWYVTGQSSAFAAEGLPEIGPDQLGWTPNLITDDGVVASGDEVLTSLDEGEDAVGLVAEELLALAWDSAEAQDTTGEWEADAALFLKTPSDVAPGSYSATLTLTLWEDGV